MNRSVKVLDFVQLGGAYATLYLSGFSTPSDVPFSLTTYSPVVRVLVGPLVVVEPKVLTQPPPNLKGVGVGFQVHLLVLHCAPQPLQKDVFDVPPLTIHADPHPSILKNLGELPAGELAPLVGVEHLRPSPLQRFSQSLGTETRL